MASLGDDVTKHLVGTAAEPHQRCHPIQPLEFSALGRARAPVGQQAIGAEQVDRQIGNPLAQFAGEDFLDADFHGRDDATVQQ